MIDPYEVARLFSRPVCASAGHAEPDSIHELSPLQSKEIPEGFHKWVEKRQREYRAGRHHARRALEAAGGQCPPIARGLDGLPRFPEGFAGSITHTGRKSTFAAAVVGKSMHQYGLDAEQLRPIDDRMVRLILTKNEQADRDAGEECMDGSGELSKIQTHALLAFSAKEAFYKCVYPRCREKLGFHDVELNLLGGDRFSISVTNPSYTTVPSKLSGRFLMKDELVLCGVTWPAN